MGAAPKRLLHLVDPTTGEVTEEACPNCAEKDRTYAELERKYRGVLTQLGNLRADKDAEARKHNLWPAVAGLFLVWRDECNHPRSPFASKRFWQAEEAVRTYGEDFCRLAIMGAAYQPYVGEARKNGTRPRFDDWELIFRAPEKTEDFARRAPIGLIEASRWEWVDGTGWRLKVDG